MGASLRKIGLRAAVMMIALSALSPARGLADTASPEDMAAQFEQAHITQTDMAGRVENAVLSGSVPLFIGFASAALTQEINDRVEDAVAAERSAVMESTRGVSFWYDVKIGGTSGEIVSVLVYAKRTGVSSMTSVTSVNFSIATEKTLRLNSIPILGVNGIKLANKYILSRVKAEPDRYNDDFNGIVSETDFALDGSVVTIYFDEFEIAPGTGVVVEFNMPKEYIKNCYLSNDEYYLQKNSLYNLKMIELNKVSREFGYSLVWDGAWRRVYVYRDKALVTTLVIGVNEYNKGRLPKRALEAAPEIASDRTRVPLSFFEDILEQSYHIDSMGTITFSEFRVPPSD
ncbi:MAG: copper amine oxidase N-terminal domain-containing protein [Clostridiales bacterium]|jgi:hypothetical protein|nr:copper amine oxidase N-terminal domain-containing protein [Clostridiales bacterium]